MMKDTKTMIFVGAAAVGSLVVGYFIAKLTAKKPDNEQDKEDV